MTIKYWYFTQVTYISHIRKYCLHHNPCPTNTLNVNTSFEDWILQMILSLKMILVKKCTKQQDNLPLTEHHPSMQKCNVSPQSESREQGRTTWKKAILCLQN